jgi:hypothetical protein
MYPNKPEIGSKEGPAISDVKVSQLAKQQTEMTVGKFYALLLNQGVFSFSCEAGANAIHITLRAHHDFGDGEKVVKVEVDCPKGHPFPLYAMQAYEELLAVIEGRTDQKSEPQSVEQTAAPLRNTPAPAPIVGGSVRKAPGMPTPKRTPITQGLCKRKDCQQPVAWPGHDHCSPTCAREDFVERAAKKAGIKLP